MFGSLGGMGQFGMQPQGMLDRFGTRVGDAIVGMNNPFGSISGLSPQDRQNQISMGLLQLAGSVEAAGHRGGGALEGLGQGIQQLQQGGAQSAQMRMQGLKFQQEQEQAKAEADRKAALTESVSKSLAGQNDPTSGAGPFNTLDPKQKAVALMWLQAGQPDKAMEILGHQGAQANEYGINPIWTKDKDGKWQLYQSDKAGGAPNLMQFPPGTEPQPNVTYQDLGTSIIPMTTKGANVAGPSIPVDNQGKAAATAQGAVQGGAAATLPGSVVDAKRTVKQIDDLLADPNLGSSTGWQGNIPDALLPFMPGAGQSAFNERTKINQLKGKAFLAAYDTLRGGGAITEVEGQKAGDAMARLQTAQSDSDYKAALQDFRDAVQTGLDKLAAKAGTTAPDVTGTSSLKSKYGLE